MGFRKRVNRKERTQERRIRGSSKKFKLEDRIKTDFLESLRASRTKKDFDEIKGLLEGLVLKTKIEEKGRYSGELKDVKVGEERRYRPYISFNVLKKHIKREHLTLSQLRALKIDGMFIGEAEKYLDKQLAKAEKEYGAQYEGGKKRQKIHLDLESIQRLNELKRDFGHNTPVLLQIEGELRKKRREIVAEVRKKLLKTGKMRKINLPKEELTSEIIRLADKGKNVNQIYTKITRKKQDVTWE